MNPNNRVTGALRILSRGAAYKDLQAEIGLHPPPCCSMPGYHPNGQDCTRNRIAATGAGH